MIALPDRIDFKALLNSRTWKAASMNMMLKHELHVPVQTLRLWSMSTATMKVKTWEVIEPIYLKLQPPTPAAKTTKKGKK